MHLNSHAGRLSSYYHELLHRKEIIHGIPSIHLSSIHDIPQREKKTNSLIKVDTQGEDLASASHKLSSAVKDFVGAVQKSTTQENIQDNTENEAPLLIIDSIAGPDDLVFELGNATIIVANASQGTMDESDSAEDIETNVDINNDTITFNDTTTDIKETVDVTDDKIEKIPRRMQRDSPVDSKFFINGSPAFRSSNNIPPVQTSVEKISKTILKWPSMSKFN